MEPQDAGGSTKTPLLDRRRILVLAGLAAVVAAFFAVGLQGYFGLEALDENIRLIKSWVAGNRLLASLAFMGVYACAVVLFPPSGTAMTLAGGFIFGWLLGGTLVIIGATVGATMLFLIAKTTLGDPLQARAGPKIRKLEAGFQRNAFSYLLILRLIPLVPFWLVNIAPAFLGVRLRTFVLATFIGIIPGTFVYASLGSGLGRLAAADVSLGDLMGLEFLLPAAGLAVLALLPIVYKRFVGRDDG
ncbi:MAG: TVP38/TMEM64 family protein [Alphaproteobacteria bacterium]|nr:TVP38/TMEM64 family protein [Alphaproteobacteria bacterium]